MDAGDWFAALAVVVSIVSVGAAAYFRKDALAAVAAAQRAAEAAERSANAAEDSAKASREYTNIEAARRADEVSERQQAEAMRTKAILVTRARRDALTIRNEGPADARDVRFEPTNDSVFWGPDQQALVGEAFELRVGESRTSPFTAYAHRPQLITGDLSWTDAAGQHREARSIDILGSD